MTETKVLTVALPRCSVCQLRLDPALTLAGYRTHPCCDPDEVTAPRGPGFYGGQPSPEQIAKMDTIESDLL